MKSLSIIQQAQILKIQDWQDLYSLRDELQDTFCNVQVFRTRTEMEASILNDLKFPTADSKYWQAVREQNVMFNELVLLSYEYRKNLVEIKQLEHKILDEWLDEFEKELLQIEIEKKQFIALQQERTAKDRIREIKEWHMIKENLKPNMVCSLSDCNEHQLVSYTTRWINQLLGSGESGSLPERNNLLGQLDKGLKLCEEKGCIDRVWENFNDINVKLIIKKLQNELKISDINNKQNYINNGI